MLKKTVKEFEKLSNKEKNSMKGLTIFMQRFYIGAKFRIDIAKDPESGRYTDIVAYVERPEDIYKVLVEHKAGFMDCSIEGFDEYEGVNFYPGMFSVKYYCDKCKHFHNIGTKCSMLAFRHFKYKVYEVII